MTHPKTETANQLINEKNSKLNAKLRPKIDHPTSCWQVGRSSKNTKTLKVLQGFWAPRHSNFEAKLTNIRPQSDQKSSKKLINILTQFLIDFWSNLDPFGEDFGFQVGTKLGPNAIKARFQNQSKKTTAFWKAAGSILGGFWLPLGRGWFNEMFFGGPVGSWGFFRANQLISLKKIWRKNLQSDFFDSIHRPGGGESEPPKKWPTQKSKKRTS